MTPAELVLAARQHLGLTQAEWARVLHVSPGTPTRWENGTSAPGDLALALATRIVEIGGARLVDPGIFLRGELASGGDLAALRQLLNAVHDVAGFCDPIPPAGPGVLSDVPYPVEAIPLPAATPPGKRFVGIAHGECCFTDLRGVYRHGSDPPPLRLVAGRVVRPPGWAIFAPPARTSAPPRVECATLLGAVWALFCDDDGALPPTAEWCVGPFRGEGELVDIAGPGVVVGAPAVGTVDVLHGKATVDARMPRDLPYRPWATFRLQQLVVNIAHPLTVCWGLLSSAKHMTSAEQASCLDLPEKYLVRAPNTVRYALTRALDPGEYVHFAATSLADDFYGFPTT